MKRNLFSVLSVFFLHLFLTVACRGGATTAGNESSNNQEQAPAAQTDRYDEAPSPSPDANAEKK